MLKKTFLSMLLVAAGVISNASFASDITTTFPFIINLIDTSSDANQGFFVLPTNDSTALDAGELKFINRDDNVSLHSQSKMSFRVTKTYDESSATNLDYYLTLQSFEVLKNSVLDTDLTNSFGISFGGVETVVGDAARLVTNQASMNVEITSAYIDPHINNLEENDLIRANATILVQALIAI